MRHLKIVTIMASSLLLTTLMAMTGCGDHEHHYDNDRHHYETQNVERHGDRHDSDRHDYHGGNYGHDQDGHGDR